MGGELGGKLDGKLDVLGNELDDESLVDGSHNRKRRPRKLARSKLLMPKNKLYN